MSKEKKQVSGHAYLLHLTKRQVELLSYACDRFSRLICGQDWTYQELMEEAWEKRCKEATGKIMDKEWDGGWYAMRHEAEEICKNIKKKFWNLEWNAMNGIHYDDTADILFDCHQVLRHQLWIDRPEGEKSHSTVDADDAMRFGSEPLAEIERSDRPVPSKRRKRLMDAMEDIFARINGCTEDLSHAKGDADKEDIALHRMVALMADTKKVLEKMAGFLREEE